MKIDDIVVTVNDFEELRKEWGFNYPKKGAILTISNITEHPNLNVNKKGIVLLHFKEIPDLIGVCDKQIDGTPNFIKINQKINLK